MIILLYLFYSVFILSEPLETSLFCSDLHTVGRCPALLRQVEETSSKCKHTGNFCQMKIRLLNKQTRFYCKWIRDGKHRLFVCSGRLSD